MSAVNWQLIEMQTTGRNPVHLANAYSGERELNKLEDGEEITELQQRARKLALRQTMLDALLHLDAVKVKIECDDRDDIGRLAPILTTISPTISGWFITDQLLNEASRAIETFSRANKRRLAQHWEEQLALQIQMAKQSRIMAITVVASAILSLIGVLLYVFH